MLLASTEERRKKEEGEEEGVLSKALEVFTEQHKSLLEALQLSFKFRLEEILGSGLDTLDTRRHRKLASYTCI